MWTETIPVVWGHATPGVEGRSCRRVSGGFSEARLDAVATARPTLETRNLVGGLNRCSCRLRKWDPVSCFSPASLSHCPSFLLSLPLGPDGGAGVSGGLRVLGMCPLGFPTDKSDLHPPDDCPDLIRTVGHERTFLVSSPVTHVAWVKMLRL